MIGLTSGAAASSANAATDVRPVNKATAAAEIAVFSKGFFLGEEYQFAFLGMALWAGLTAGMAFPFANRLYLAKDEGDRLGSVYAADLRGSALGALLTAGFFIPIWGVPQTLMLLGAVNVLLALLLLFRKDVGRKDL